jgi:hypothetical protein
VNLRCFPTLLAFLLCGCIRAGYGDAPRDGSRADAPGGDLAAPDRSLPDHPSMDQPGLDLPGPDIDLLGCDAPLDPSVVARWSFDTLNGTQVPEETGNHPGTVTGGTAQLVAGAPGCGQGLSIPAGLDGQPYVVVPYAPEWQLPQGSVDFWVRFDTLDKTQGIIGRDSLGEQTSGHLTLFRACDGALVVRLQRGVSEGIRCSQPVPDGVWLHVGVNFGGAAGLQLFVDGTPATRTGTVIYSKHGVTTCAHEMTCGTNVSGGIDGNSNPWVIGAISFASTEGTTDQISHHLGGTIDALRISATPRSFAP